MIIHNYIERVKQRSSYPKTISTRYTHLSCNRHQLIQVVSKYVIGPDMAKKKSETQNSLIHNGVRIT